ncbi:MAG TPA: hypothetical protein PK760_16430 [Flavobacteriales bacterium]|nr:hypothetical protein [Flavobacteriales bacterium]
MTGNYAVLANFGGGCSLASTAQWFSPVGVSELERSVVVQPVPASDALRVTGLSDARAITLLDASGRVQVSVGVTQGGSVVVPVGELANGMYSLVARDAKGIVLLRRQVMVQH